MSDGVWRSLVARVFWEHEVEGSNPFTPTILFLFKQTKTNWLKLNKFKNNYS